MKKLMLELDALEVESFATGAGPNTEGTVRGRGYTGEWECGGDGGSEVSCPAGCSDLCTRTCDSGAAVCCAND